MGRVTDHSLIEIANLYGDAAFSVGQGTEVADMTISASPYWRSSRHFAGAPFKPLIELNAATTDVSVRRAGHFQISGLPQSLSAFLMDNGRNGILFIVGSNLNIRRPDARCGLGLSRAKGRAL